MPVLGAGCAGKATTGADADKEAPGLALEFVRAMRTPLPCQPYGAEHGGCQVVVLEVSNPAGAEEQGLTWGWQGVSARGAVFETRDVRAPAAVVGGGAATVQLFFGPGDGTDLKTVRRESYGGAAAQVAVGPYSEPRSLWPGVDFSLRDLGRVRGDPVCWATCLQGFLDVDNREGLQAFPPPGVEVSATGRDGWRPSETSGSVPAGANGTLRVLAALGDGAMQVHVGSGPFREVVAFLTEDELLATPWQDQGARVEEAVLVAWRGQADADSASEAVATLEGGWPGYAFDGAAHFVLEESLLGAPAALPVAEWDLEFTAASFATRESQAILLVDVPWDLQDMAAYQLRAQVTVAATQQTLHAGVAF